MKEVMRSIGIKQVQREFPAILRGESFVITRRGIPIAKVLLYDEPATYVNPIGINGREIKDN